MRYKVITYNDAALAQSAEKLVGMMEGFIPDFVIGIPSGGALVAELFFPGVPHFNIASQRDFTSAKKKPLFSTAIRLLPLWLLDRLRIFEAVVLSKRSADNQSRQLPKMAPETADALSKARSVLIVDDAVDSGVTLRTVKEAVRAVAPESCEIRSAALTVTTESPVAMPDYYLFHDFTLLRFPWSADYRN